MLTLFKLYFVYLTISFIAKDYRVNFRFKDTHFIF
jgi:hypothetical protein